MLISLSVCWPKRFRSLAKPLARERELKSANLNCKLFLCCEDKIPLLSQTTTTERLIALSRDVPYSPASLMFASQLFATTTSGRDEQIPFTRLHSNQPMISLLAGFAVSAASQPFATVINGQVKARCGLNLGKHLFRPRWARDRHKSAVSCAR